MGNIIKYTQKTLDPLLEEIHQYSEGCCPFCFADDFPVKGDKSGYDEVLPEDAEGWRLEHYPDCLVLDLENALLKARPDGII